MARWGRCDYEQLKKLNKRLEQLAKADTDTFLEEMVIDIAKRLLTKVVKRTPVGKKPRIAAKDENDKKSLGGVNAKKTEKIKSKSRKSKSFLTREGEIYQQYWSGYRGGTLRDAWTILPIEKQGDNYIVTVINNTEYASYVEYGHRQKPGRYVPALGKKLKSSWVKGHYMLTISTQELERQAPKIIERKLYNFMKGCFDAE